MKFARADLENPAVVALLEHHVREAHRNSPPGSVFALDLSGLRAPHIRLWSVWDGETLLGLGAWKAWGAGDAEVKSMRTAPGHERKGVGRAMLAHLIADARAAGMTRVLLETGTNDAFAPARAMYEAAGFRPTGAFGNYELTDFNRCYARAI
ncbi:GNAT family N-acetyltransferase [uncultured Sphingomonas sp.]|uniref:GNAT family N-acetyltransferase n=1 Tax=uncultured Sphingomonas sp. TaxID=158754 RepID=UPI0025D9297B|nr:GNAT family N-acetyltransferase [uncultured Sphingomonas sp.]